MSSTLTDSRGGELETEGRGTLSRPLPSEEKGPVTTVHQEIEAKLLVPSARTLNTIGRLGRLGPYRFRARAAQRLHSIYIDTPDMVLARHTVGLRLRRAARRWELTAKWGGAVTGDVHQRPELTVSLPRRPRPPLLLPQGPIRDRLIALVADRPLDAVLVTDIHRRRLAVLPESTRGGRSVLAEIALDRVALRAPHDRAARARYHEVEIEVIGSHRRHVTRLARLLRERFDLAPSRESKLDRGMRLVYGRKRPRPIKPGPRRARTRIQP